MFLRSQLSPPEEGTWCSNALLQAGNEEIASSCLSHLGREKEQTTLLLPHGVRLGFTGTGGNAQTDYQMHQIRSQGRGREVAEFALTQASLHLLAPRRSCWSKITYTQIALLLCSSLVLCRPLCTARRAAPDLNLPWSLIIPGELRELP